MNKIILIIVSLILITISLSVSSADLSQAQQLCNNASEAQKQAARAAGYDVDALCASLKQQQSNQNAANVNNQNGQILPREIAEFPMLQEQSKANELDSLKKADSAQDNEKLKKFGYDLFAGVPTTFTPVTNIPIPTNYIIGPGDSIEVLLFGKTNQSYSLIVDRDGSIQFPELGPINVSGLSYTEMKETLGQRINEQMIGVQANITMGELRSMQIFVLGEAYKPGSYTVSSLSTITHALFVSGGVKEVGSLRNIQLKRNGRLVATLDLYDLLLKGDTRRDKRLQPGDVIYIPTIKKTASVSGEVVRPAIYEIKNEKTISQLLNLAGGALATAYPQDSIIERINRKGLRTVLDIDLTSNKGRNVGIRNGDWLKIFPVLEKNENIISLLGHIYRPGNMAWKKGIQVKDVLNDPNMLKPNANIDFVLVVRETLPLQELKTYKVSLRDIIENTNKNSGFKLNPRDKIIVLANAIDLEGIEEKFDEADFEETIASVKIKERNKDLKNVNTQLRAQASFTLPAQLVSISGAVKFPDEYPLVDGMSVKDLIQIAGGFTEDAYTVEAEITRKDLSDPIKADVFHLPIDLQQEFLGSVSFKLSPHDSLIIKVTPEYRLIGKVELHGEVKFPGIYNIRRGETLTELLDRAGGFSDFAHIQASIFSRQELRVREQKELKKLRARLKEELTAEQIAKNSITNKSTDVSAVNSLIETLDETEATGRLVIDINSIVKGSSSDINLRNGDRLLVPEFRQEVTVIGEVQVPTSHVYNGKLDFDDYIKRSGGEKKTADEEAIYIVKADGSLVLPNKNNWLNHDDFSVQPGDTIVVPVDTDRVNQLELWSSISQIVYQLALGAAAIRSF